MRYVYHIFNYKVTICNYIPLSAHCAGSGGEGAGPAPGEGRGGPGGAGARQRRHQLAGRQAGAVQGAAAGVAGVQGAAAGGVQGAAAGVVQGAAAGSMHWARHRLQGRRHAGRGRGHRRAEDIVNYINTKREAATMTMAFRWRLAIKNISYVIYI